MGDTPQQPQQIDTPPYPGTTRIENGQAYDVANNSLGAVDDQGKPVSSAPAPAVQKEVDYDALAKQAGSVGSTQVNSAGSTQVDYDALAKQAGSIGSTSASAPQEGLVGPEGPTSIGARPSSSWKDIFSQKGYDDVRNWTRDVQSDVRDGSDVTWVGSLLKKLGAKGTAYGVAPGVASAMPNPISGAAGAISGVNDIAEEVDKGIRTGDMSAVNIMGGANAVVRGATEALGLPGVLMVPEAKLPVLASALVSQNMAQQVASAMGADSTTAEFVGNVAGFGTAGLLDHFTTPVVERFGVAVNNRGAAEQEYIVRARNLETARGQAAEAHQRALDAAQKETAGQGTAQQTIAARQLANDATKNVADAQKAFDQAADHRADATMEVENLHRRIQKAAAKKATAEYEATASEAEKAKNLFQKAVPSKGANQYTDDEYETVRADLEEAKKNGVKVTDLPSAYEVVENARQAGEDAVKPAIEKYSDEPLTENPEDSPKMKVAAKLDEMAKVDGNFSDAMDHLSNFNITDPTVGEAQDILTKLNSYNRAVMKGANNWDIYNMIETRPDFAARYFMAEELRDGIYNRLEGHGVEGAREMRMANKARINVRDAIGAQIRANRGGTTVRGSGTSSTMRALVGKLTGKTIRGTGIAAGAELGGAPGAVLGGAVGDLVAQPVEDFLSPRDMTRDEHIEKSMRYKGTNRKPVQVKIGGSTPPIIPTEPIPPAPKTSPPSVELTPRENTELHAELAAHYGESNLEDSTYEELEQQLRDDIATKNRNGVKLSPAEKTLLTKVLKADSVDRAARLAAGKPAAEVAIAPEKEEEIIADADKRAEEGEATKLNPTLVSLGRGDESALVSHSAAMKAHAPATAISGLPEGLTSEDGHLHEWGHTAIGAVEGLEPVEIRSDLHPKSEKGAGATTVFNASSLRDASGKIDPEALAEQETKWLTQKMAGPASQEIFKGMTRDEVKASRATRADFREARSIVREVHPDFTASQVEAAVDAAYDRARDFLTKPHIADRIRANAAVREEGLSPTLHASHGRVNQFAEDIRNAHNEYNGNSGPDGGGAGEGGEKAEKPAAEGKTPNAGGDKSGRGEGTQEPLVEVAATSRGTEVKPEESRVIQEPELRVPYKEGRPIPPERSAGKYDSEIKTGGAIPAGIQKGDPDIGLKDLALFHDPTTGSTLALPTDKISAEAVKAQLQKSREAYLHANPQESRIPAPGQPGYDEAIHGGRLNVPEEVAEEQPTPPWNGVPQKEEFSGVHYSSVPAENGVLRGATRGAAKAGSEQYRVQLGAEPGIYAYREGTQPEPQIAMRQNKYAINGQKAIADISGPQHDLFMNAYLKTKQAAIDAGDYDREAALKGINAAEKAVKDAGFDGYESKKDYPGSVFLFGDQNVSEPSVAGAKTKAIPEGSRFVEATSEEHRAALDKNPQGATLATETPEEMKNYKISKLVTPTGEDTGIQYHITPNGEAGGLINNGPYKGATKVALQHAAENGATHANSWDVQGALPALYEKHGLIKTDSIPYDEKTYGPPSEALKSAWKAAGWKEGEPYPSVQNYAFPHAVPELAHSMIQKSPKGSSVPLMENPLPVKGTIGAGDEVGVLDITKALNKFSRSQNPALEPGSEPKEVVARAHKIAEDEAKYQLAQNQSGTTWYTTQMKDHDRIIQEMRPELATGPKTDVLPDNPVNMTLFKAAEAILSSGQNPYANVKSALQAWDYYKATGDFSPVSPLTGKSWGPRNMASYGAAFDSLNKLIQEKGEKGAADWLLSEHPVRELRSYQSPTSVPVRGKASNMEVGSMILGAKRGPFMQNLHGIESKFTADMWVSRTWNRWMGTLDLDPNIGRQNKMTSDSDSPRNSAERELMHQSFAKTANKLGLTTSSLQAVLWYYEQALYRAHGIPVESWSFSDAAKRVADEEKQPTQDAFDFGARAKGGLENMSDRVAQLLDFATK